MEKRCYIFGAGEDCGGLPDIPPGSLVIAADGGYARLLQAGVAPDLTVGDFDSLGYVPDSGEVLRFRREKDDTDTGLAVGEGLKRGCDAFYIYGGTGGRLDHTLANIQCLARLAQAGRRGFLFGDGFVVTAVTDGKIAFDEGRRGVVSVFAHSDRAFGVRETGLKYPLDNAELSNCFPLGVSNAFTGRASEISVERGTLIVLYRLFP